jgi:hypothetical protein
MRRQTGQFGQKQQEYYIDHQFFFWGGFIGAFLLVEKLKEQTDKKLKAQTTVKL